MSADCLADWRIKRFLEALKAEVGKHINLQFCYFCFWEKNRVSVFNHHMLKVFFKQVSFTRDRSCETFRKTLKFMKEKREEKTLKFMKEEEKRKQ